MSAKHGGPRPGSGRKPTGRTRIRVSIYIMKWAWKQFQEVAEAEQSTPGKLIERQMEGQPKTFTGPLAFVAPEGSASKPRWHQGMIYCDKTCQHCGHVTENCLMLPDTYAKPFYCSDHCESKVAAHGD